jgi:hypothetical protein
MLSSLPTKPPCWSDVYDGLRQRTQNTDGIKSREYKFKLN